MVPVASSSVLIVFGSFWIIVQTAEVTAVHTDAFNSKQGDGECSKEMRVKGENSSSISTNVFNNPISNYSGCPPWYHQSPSVSGNDTVFACGNRLRGVVHCDDRFYDLYVLICYCMYFNEEDNSTIIFVGKCFTHASITLNYIFAYH